MPGGILVEIDSILARTGARAEDVLSAIRAAMSRWANERCRNCSHPRRDHRPAPIARDASRTYCRAQNTGSMWGCPCIGFEKTRESARVAVAVTRDTLLHDFVSKLEVPESELSDETIEILLRQTSNEGDD